MGCESGAFHFPVSKRWRVRLDLTGEGHRYRVIGMGFKRVGVDNHYSFTFQRIRHQASLRANRPFVHEYEDWCDYMIYKEERKLSAQLDLVQLDGGWAAHVVKEDDKDTWPHWFAPEKQATRGGRSRFHLAEQGPRGRRRASSEDLSPRGSQATMRKSAEKGGMVDVQALDERAVSDSGEQESSFPLR